MEKELVLMGVLFMRTRNGNTKEANFCGDRRMISSPELGLALVLLAFLREGLSLQGSSCSTNGNVC